MVEDVLIPDPLFSRQQADRFYHSDLPGLADVELEDEFHCLRPLLWGLPAEHWLRQRVQMLEGELTKRRRQPKPKLAEGVKF